MYRLKSFVFIVCLASFLPGGPQFLRASSNTLLTGLNHPYDIVYDVAGNLYIAEREGCRVRKLTPSGGLTTVAGNGIAASTGDGLVATSASINYPQGLALDSSGNLYIAEAYGNRVRKVNGQGIISTIAGTVLMLPHCPPSFPAETTTTIPACFNRSMASVIV